MKRISFRTPSKNHPDKNLHETMKEHYNENLKIQRRLEKKIKKNSGKVFYPLSCTKNNHL